MKKYIASFIITLALVWSVPTHAMSQSKIDVIVSILKAFEVQQSKINKIVDILTEKPTKPVETLKKTPKKEEKKDKVICYKQCSTSA